MANVKLLWSLFWASLFIVIGILFSEVFSFYNPSDSFVNTRYFAYIYFAVYLVLLISISGLIKIYVKETKYSRTSYFFRMVGSMIGIAGIVFFIGILIAVILDRDLGLDLIVKYYAQLLTFGLLLGFIISTRWLSK